jgi:hypothetical protein
MDDEELERRLKEERVAEWVGEMAVRVPPVLVHGKG